jgi:hypothetical protein
LVNNQHRESLPVFVDSGCRLGQPQPPFGRSLTLIQRELED